MITYEVRYRKQGKGRWEVLPAVKADGFIFAGPDGQPLSLLPTRFFILSDESRVEVPTEGTTFVFSKERFLAVKEQMSREAGQQVVTSE